MNQPAIPHAELLARLRVALANGPLTTRQLCPIVRVSYQRLKNRMLDLHKRGLVVGEKIAERCGMSSQDVWRWSMAETLSRAE